VPTRKGPLSATVFDLPSATSYLERVQMFRYGVDTDLDEARGIASRYESEVPVKEGDEFTFSLTIDQSGTPKSNLDVSTFSFNSVALVGDLKDGSITVSNGVKDGSGVADRKRYPHLVPPTSLQIEGDFLINAASGVQNAEFVRAASAGSLADKTAAYAINAGGVQFSGNATIQRAEHVLEMDELQMYSATLKGKGTPTVSGHALIVSAATGTGSTGYAITTGANVYSGTAVIVEAVLNIRDAALLRADFRLQVFGAPTVTAS
jgi:hypothetical protein